MNELQELWLDLQSPAIALELTGLAVALFAAWLISWASGRRFISPNSILFGRRLVDGVLFPALALVFTYGAKLLLTKVQHMPMPVLKVALPVLVSLPALPVSWLSSALPLPSMAAPPVSVRCSTKAVSV